MSHLEKSIVDYFIVASTLFTQRMDLSVLNIDISDHAHITCWLYTGNEGKDIWIVMETCMVERHM
jgi:hypothetical protein